MHIDYMAVLGDTYPDVRAVCFGDPSVYENIQVEGDVPLPSKLEMDAKILERMRAFKVAELSRLCRAEIVGGFVSEALGSKNLYDAEEVDQLNLVGSVASIAPTPEYPNGTMMPYAVRPIVEGVQQPKVYAVHTHPQLRQVMQDGTRFKLMRLQRFNQKRDYVNFKCNSHEEIDAVTWESVEPTE